MKKVFLVFLGLVISQTTIQADNFGAGFATGAFTGIVLNEATRPRGYDAYYVDPVAYEDARNMRAERQAAERARRAEELAEKKRLKAINKKISALQKEIKVTNKKLDREKDPKKMDLYAKSIKEMKEQLQDLEDEMEA